MKINTLTAVVGTAACNARCPYCVSRMTPDCGVDGGQHAINTRNFRIACQFAVRSGVNTVLLTGKGEPTLFPEQIDQFVSLSDEYFPFVELQTNGIRLLDDDLNSRLRHWHDQGMTLICISIAHYNNDRNAEIFRPGRPYDLWSLVPKLHDFGFAVRLNCTMVKGYLDSFAELRQLVDRSREAKVEQITVREVTRPASTEDPDVAAYVDEHSVAGLGREFQKAFASDPTAAKLLELPHGAIVYDWDGQNICLGNCLTETKDPEDIRQLIFFPDGHLRYSWQYEGAIIL